MEMSKRPLYYTFYSFVVAVTAINILFCLGVVGYTWVKISVPILFLLVIAMNRVASHERRMRKEEKEADDNYVDKYEFGGYGDIHTFPGIILFVSWFASYLIAIFIHNVYN